MFQETQLILFLIIIKLTSLCSILNTALNLLILLLPMHRSEELIKCFNKKIIFIKINLEMYQKDVFKRENSLGNKPTNHVIE